MTDFCPLCGVEDGGTSCGAQPCGLIDNTPELGDAEQYTADLLALVQACRAIGRTSQITREIEQMKAALDKFEPWLEQDDPRSMGWVDDKGRP